MCGAAVSKVEDLNSAMMPVSIIVVIGFYLGYFTSVAGGGSNALSKLALYLPISSPFAVPFKILTGDIATQELLISMGILAAAIVVVCSTFCKNLQCICYALRKSIEMERPSENEDKLKLKWLLEAIFSFLFFLRETDIRRPLF